MSDIPKNKKSIPWLKVGIVLLILVSIIAVYLFKNLVTSNQSAQDGLKNSSSMQNSQGTAKALPKLVDLGSNSCIPCKQMAPILAELKKDYSGVVDVEVVDVYKEEEKTRVYNRKHTIRVIPTQILFDANGKEVWSNEGFIAKENIIKAFNEKLGIK